MPIYEFYCPENHTVYQFYAKTLAQGQTLPRCPDNPKFTMRKVVSAFAITGRSGKDEEAEGAANAGADAAGDPSDPRMEAAMSAMENEFSAMDENDPKAMARMMRRMSELTGEKLDGEMEEVVRKLEEGADPESLEEQLGSDEGGEDSGMEDGMPEPGDGTPGADAAKEAKERKARRRRFKVRRAAPRRDPKLYDYE